MFGLFERKKEEPEPQQEKRLARIIEIKKERNDTTDASDEWTSKSRATE